jgi:GAF domain-containing protein
VGAPISVEGRLWGVIVVGSTSEAFLPADAEARLAGFAELVATAVANTQARVELRGFAEEQAALRRVATLVAGAAAPEEVLAAVAGEVGRLLEVDYTALMRSDPEDMITVVGTWTSTGVAAPSPVGSRFELGGRNVSTLVAQDGPAGTPGCLRRRLRHHRGYRCPRVGLPLVGGCADQRRGAAVGPHSRGVHA